MKKYSLLFFTLFLFEISSINAQYSILHSFNGSDGSVPSKNVVVSGGVAYGMTPTGGKYGLGTIFSVDTNGSGFKVLLDFNDTNGANPTGSLIISANTLYGVTYTGGVAGMGNVFSIHTDGSSYKDLKGFKDSNGGYSEGSLTLVGATLYGTESQGWAKSVTNTFGVIFSIDTNGGGYKNLYYFNTANTPSGADPYGTLTFSGGKLYGLTYSGGSSGLGNIYSINTDGTGYKDLYDFYNSEYNFVLPNGDGHVVISGGKLYGMTYQGGNGGPANVGVPAGNIFSLDTNGGGYKDLLDFDGPNGGSPFGSLTISGGFLYGMTLAGNVGDGFIFSIDTNGLGFRDIFDFNGINGAYPYGDVTIIGNTFYGMTGYGGTSDSGVVFKFRDTMPACLNNYVQPICIVTFDTATGSNVIIWDRNSSPPNSSYNVYDSISFYSWALLGTVSDTALSEYVDTTSMFYYGPTSYRITTIDSCGESPSSPFSTPMYLQAIQRTSYDSLYWTPYVGFVSPYYLVFRGPSMQKIKLIDSVSTSVLSIVDSLPPAGSLYLVEAVNPSGGCTPTHSHSTHGAGINQHISFSNSGIPYNPVGIAGMSSPQSIIRVSPNPNNGIFTIQTSGITSKSEIEVYNMVGEKVYSRQLSIINSQFSIDITNQPAGIYLYRVVSESGNLIGSGKFVTEE